MKGGQIYSQGIFQLCERGGVATLFDGDLLVFTFEDLCQFSLEILEGKVRRQISTVVL